MFVVFVVAYLALSGTACEKKFAAAEYATTAAPKVTNLASPREKNNSLAYEHRLSIEIAKELLAERVEAVRAACIADTENGCTLLEISDQSRQEVPEGSVRMRIAPKGVDTISKLAAEGGSVTSRLTSAEDLAQPIADTERQLALLNLHRERLMELMRRKDIGVSDLITVSRELATVQSQLEEFGAQKANLRRRVDTELLSINWSPPLGTFQSAQSPITDALRSFGADFREAVGQIIVFLAYLLPWLAIGIPALILLRWLWRRIGVWVARQRAT
jgi:hypothetical protein